MRWKVRGSGAYTSRQDVRYRDKVIRRQPETKTNHKILLWWDMRQRQRSDTIAAKWRAMSMGRSQKGVCRHLFMSRTQPVCTGSSRSRHWITPIYVLVMMRKTKVFLDREVLKKRYTNEFVVHGKSEKELRLQQMVHMLFVFEFRRLFISIFIMVVLISQV